MTARIRQLSVLAFAVLLTVSTFAPAVGASVAAPADAGGHDDLDGAPVEAGVQQANDRAAALESAQFSTGSAAPPNGSDGGVLSDGLQNASGTVQVVVRLEPVRVGGDVSAQSLRAKTTAAQRPVTAWAADTQGATVLEQFWLANAVLLEVDTDRVDLESVAGLSGVRHVHPNFEVSIPEPAQRPAATASGNASDYNVTYGLDQINASDVWSEYGTRGGGVEIAVLDTGVHADHPDIDIKDENFVKVEADGTINNTEAYDSSYHGTHVSGTVVGTNESGQYIGVAPNATLLHGMVIPGGSGTFAQIVGGMQWAVQEDAEVISMSLGANGYYPAFVEPVQNAQDAGSIVVSSSGNSYEGTSGSPANVYDAYAIGASDDDRDIADFSSGEVIDTSESWGIFAPDYWPEEYVVPDVSAPGVLVLSAVPPGTFPNNPDVVYAYANGTSMAAPHVTGAIALMESASSSDLTVDQVEAALTTTATKPADAPAEKDNRYGEGIIDAEAATDRVAADSGVTGTVTDADGDPIEGATVTLDGYPTWTDADGEYTLHADNGTYEVTVRAFGYGNATREVTVSNGSFVTENFTLTGGLAAEVTDGQPSGAADGESFNVTARVANVESLTVDQVGDYDGDVTVEVRGTTYDTGEQITFGSPVSGELTVTVHTEAGETGTVELRHTFAGGGDSIQATTGPTTVFDQWVDVGVVDLEDSSYGENIAKQLREEVSPRFRFTQLTPEQAVDAAEDGDYDAYLVQNLGSDDAVVRDFVDATSGTQTGVVFLDQFGAASNGIERLSAATGDPQTVVDAVMQGNAEVRYSVTSDHRIFQGVAGEGETVDLYTPTPIQFFGGFHSYFQGYDGLVNAETVADTEVGSETTGGGVAVDSLSRTVLAASLGQSSYVGPLDFEDGALTVLGNAVEYAASGPPVTSVDLPSERVDPGAPVTAQFGVEGLEEVNVEVADGSGLTADDLQLYLNGKVNAFGEWRAYDPAKNGTLNVSVLTEDSVTASSVKLDVTLRFADGTNLTATLPSTSVYEPPLEVPSDTDSINHAVDVAVPGEEIVVADGTYEELADRQDEFTDVGVWVDTPGVTLRAAENATPKVVLDENASQFNGDVMRVEAAGVTIEGLNVNADVAENSANGTYHMGIELEGASDVTLRDLHVSGNTGLRFEGDVHDVHASNVTVHDAFIGVGTGYATRRPNSNVSVEGITYHSESGFNDATYWNNVEDVSVSDSAFHLTGSDRAAYTDLADGVTYDNITVYGDGTADGVVHSWGDNFTLTDSSFANTSTAVQFTGFIDTGVAAHNNTVTDSETGISLDAGPEVSLTHNTIDAETGVRFADSYSAHEPGLVHAQYNDLSSAGTPFHVAGDVADGGAMDVRLNYVGDRNATDTIVDSEAGNATYDPFLTAPPGQVDTDQTTQIGTDLRVEANETYGVGVPGPVDGTLSDVVSSDFQGAIYGWDADSQSWEMLTGNDSVGALDAIAVVADSEGRLTMSFQSGDSPSSPGVRSLDTGWNFIASPQYTSANDAFDTSTADATLLLSMFAEPSSQLGPAGDVSGTYEFSPLGDNPNVSAFGGYFVYVEEDGTIPSYLYNDVTVEQLYDELGLEYESPSADVSGDVSTVVESVDDEARATRLVAQVLEHRITSALADQADGEVTRDDIESVASSVVADAKAGVPAADEHIVDAAATDALRAVIQAHLGATVVTGDDDQEDSVGDQQDAESSGHQPTVATTAPTASPAT